ncbi:MAG: flavodoxin family protein [Pseudomonadota bacterium]
MIKVAVVYHSAYGHTEALAKAVQRGAARLERIEAILIKVEDVEAHWSTLLEAAALIFGSPTYMGSVSALFKSFMDQTGKIWQQRLWKDKLAAGFTCSASLFGDKMTTLQQLNVFAMQHGMMWLGLDALPDSQGYLDANIKLNAVGSFLGAMAFAPNDLDAEHAPDSSDLETASYLGERVARAALRWNNS